ncbi:MAG: CBS domain-containing protein [Pirellulales bacterium]
MNSAIERLLGLRVEDVMRPAVVTVAAHETMEAAARQLATHEITGAPVVEESGRCVGVLSGSDYVDREAGFHPVDELVCKDTLHSPFEVQRLSSDRVEAHMSPTVQTISPKATLMQAARVMCVEHIHRLVVLDDESRPVGILSALDLVAAMVAAVEE